MSRCTQDAKEMTDFGVSTLHMWNGAVKTVFRLQPPCLYMETRLRCATRLPCERHPFLD